MCKEIEKIIMKHNGLKERPAMVICFTSEPDFETCHWISNVSRPEAVGLLQDTAKRLITNSN